MHGKITLLLLPHYIVFFHYGVVHTSFNVLSRIGHSPNRTPPLACGFILTPTPI